MIRTIFFILFFCLAITSQVIAEDVFQNDDFGDDYDVMLQEYEVLALQGDAFSQNTLGVVYSTGHGVKLDYNLAVKWFKEAATQGYAIAQFNLGGMYEDGTGLPKDDTQAIKWYQRAAKQGHLGAQINLGIKYEEGTGVPQDFSLALRWYRKAAEQGALDAQRKIAYMYRKGIGVEPNYEEANKWKRRADEIDAANAQIRADEIIETDSDKANKLYEVVTRYHLAAVRGDVAGIRSLQTLLTKQGYRPGPINGLFSDKTRAAVARFYQNNGATGSNPEESHKKEIKNNKLQ